MIERLLEAGAIIHARTTTSEFCISGVCVSSMWGTTRNPWNPDYSPGGSSGGSAAALAAGMTTLATGTDVGGSIRVPASACGVAGYKPPHGRNPDGPPFNVDRFNHCGALARSVADLAIVQNVVSGPHPDDPESLPHPPILPTAADDVSHMRIAWSHDLSYKPVAKEVRRNTEAAIDRLRNLGCECEEIALGWTDEIDRAALAWYAHFGSSSLLREAVSREPQSVSPELARLADETLRLRSDASALSNVPRVIAGMGATLAREMRHFDVFVCPAMGVPAVRADQSMWATDFTIDGISADPEFGYSLTHQFNMLSQCPVVGVPSGFAGSGVPTGIQIVGNPYDEITPVRLALAYEAQNPMTFP